MQILKETEIAERLAALHTWSLAGQNIERTLTFPDFPAAIAFVNRVAEAAEKANHHPDIDIRWNKVRLALSSHDAGGLTGLDFQLAAVIDGLAERLAE
jgi:4a-hydroxytetrahydrobiopterin dehydratase